MNPIDILLSVYRADSRNFAEFLLSLQKQECGDFRLLYRFDGEVPPEIEARLASFVGAMECGERIHCGFVRSYAALLRKSDAPYVMFADQDDVWHPGKVRRSLQVMQEAERVCGSDTPILVHSDLHVVDGDLREIAPSMMHYQALDPRRNTLKDLMIQNNVTGCTMMINRALAQIACIPDGAISHDWFVAMTAAAFGKIICIDVPLIDYRQHAENVYGAVPRSRFLGKLFQRGNIHERIRMTQEQAKLFLETYRSGLSPDQTLLLETWSRNAAEPCYAKRLFSAVRGGFRKNDLLRTLGLWWAI